MSKILISGESNSGKTTLLKTLDPKKTLVISHDGKQFPYAIPHVNIPTFGTTAELIKLITEKMIAFKEKFGEFPTNIVFDSVSKIFETIMDSMSIKHTGFKVYGELDINISEFNRFVEDQLISSGKNVIILSHALYDGDTGNYNLSGKGSFAKVGGYLSQVDHAVFIEKKSNKRVIHHKATKFPARSTLDDIPESQPIEEYNLAEHIIKLESVKGEVVEFSL